MYQHRKGLARLVFYLFVCFRFYFSAKKGHSRQLNNEYNENKMTSKNTNKNNSSHPVKSKLDYLILASQLSRLRKKTVIQTDSSKGPTCNRLWFRKCCWFRFWNLKHKNNQQINETLRQKTTKARSIKRRQRKSTVNRRQTILF